MKVEFRLGQLAKLEFNFIAGVHVASLAGVKRKRGYHSDTEKWMEGTAKQLRLMRKLRLAGVFPGGQPVRADVGGSVRNLPDEDRSRLIVEVIVIFVGVGIEAAAGFAVGVENGFQPAMRTEAGVEGMISRVGNVESVIGPHEKERGITIDEGSAETFVDASLIA